MTSFSLSSLVRSLAVVTWDMRIRRAGLVAKGGRQARKFPYAPWSPRGETRR